MQKLERCLLLLYLSLLARGAQGEDNKRERGYDVQQIALYQTLLRCTIKRSENEVFNVTVPVSGKKGQTCGELYCFPFSLCNVSWIFWSGFL